MTFDREYTEITEETAEGTEYYKGFILKFFSAFRLFGVFRVLAVFQLEKWGG